MFEQHVHLFDKEAVKKLLCAVCLKKKADTIASTNLTSVSLICKECLLFIENYEKKYGEMPVSYKVIPFLRGEKPLED